MNIESLRMMQWIVKREAKKKNEYKKSGRLCTRRFRLYDKHVYVCRM